MLFFAKDEDLENLRFENGDAIQNVEKYFVSNNPSKKVSSMIDDE
jgi:hypothetical protein